MKKSFLQIMLSLALVGIAVAQDAPKPDARGDYFLATGPVQSKITFGGALWRCNVKKLNIHEGPGLKSKVITVIKKGDTIAAYNNPYGGGEDSGGNAKDPQNRTWMRVTLNPKQYGEGKTGYVRANSRYIRPVLPKGVADSTPNLPPVAGDEPIEGGAAVAGKVGAPVAGKVGAPVAGKVGNGNGNGGKNGGGAPNINININLGGGNANAPRPGDPAPAGPPPVANAKPGTAAPVVGGIGVKFAPGWNNWTNNGTMYSTSPDQGSRIAIIKVTGIGQDGPWDDVQSKMAKHLAPHFPGLSALNEVNTEHDVFRDGVGLRVVTYTANFQGKTVDLVVDFAREDNKDGKGLVLIARATPKGDAAAAQTARSVAESLKLKK